MNTLVIRSASLERLDSLMEIFSMNGATEERVDILTHPNLMRSAKAYYPNINIIEYPFSKNFRKNLAVSLLGKTDLLDRYDRVIVLTSNLSGNGHMNVIKTAFVFGENVSLFNMNGDFIPVSRRDMFRERVLRLLLSPALILGTLFLWITCGAMIGAALARRSLFLFSEKIWKGNG